MFSKNLNLTNHKSFLKSQVTIKIIFASLILTVGLGVILRQFFKENYAQAENQAFVQQSLQTNANSNNIIENTDSETAPLDIQTREANGIALMAANFRFEQNQLMVDTCFDLPDDGDWIIWAASLVIMDKEIEYSGTIPMSNQLTSKGQAEQRCDTVYFEGLEPKTNFSNATFVVERILAYPREGEVCSPEYLAKYQQALAKKGLEITVECFVQELNQGGMSGIRVASKPETMSQEEAESLIHDYDFFLDLHGIEGPWTFTFSLEK